MYKLFATLFYCSLFSVIFGQENPVEIYDYYQKGDTIYLANGGHMRESASRNSKSMAEIPAGTRLIVTGEPSANSEVIYNLKAPFYPVKWESASGVKYGYVWQGLLAKAYAYDKDRNMLLFGWKSYSVNDNLITYSLARVDPAGKIQEFAIKDTFTYHSSYEAKVLGGMGLTNVKSILRVGMLGEACGIPTIYKYFAWDGKQYHVLPEKMSVGDAGIYYYSEDLQFPSEHKMAADVIIIKSEEMEYVLLEVEGLNGNYFSEGTKVQKYRFYKWTGKSVYELEKKYDRE